MITVILIYIVTFSHDSFAEYPVFNVMSALGSYRLTYAEALETCQVYGTAIATYEQLEAAQAAGSVLFWVQP